MDPTQTVEKTQELTEDKSKEIILQKDAKIAELTKQLEDQKKSSEDTLSKLTARIEKLEKTVDIIKLSRLTNEHTEIKPETLLKDCAKLSKMSEGDLLNTYNILIKSL